MAGDYDAIYFGAAGELDGSRTRTSGSSSGPYHFWNPGQASPATPWEQRIDELMREQTTAADLPQRQRAFAEVQQIFADELPSIYFVALARDAGHLATRDQPDAGAAGAAPSLERGHAGGRSLASPATYRAGRSSRKLRRAPRAPDVPGSPPAARGRSSSSSSRRRR